MKKNLFILIILAIFLSGCFQERNHLVINNDGSGTLEVNQVIPEGTLKLVDSMFGEFGKAMAKLASNNQEEAPKSFSEEMFGNKAQYENKLKSKNLNYEFEYFDKKMEGADLHVDYKFKFDDINKLLATDAVGTKIRLAKDNQGNFVCYIEKQPSKVDEAKMQKEKFEEWKKNLPQDKNPIRDAALEAMKGFKVEFEVTMPNDIIEVQGVFTKKDAKTASMEFSGDIFNDPSIMDKLYAMQDTPKVVCSGDGINFDIKEYQDDQSLENTETSMPDSSAHPVEAPKNPEPSQTKITLKSGKIIEGKLVEETSEYIKIDRGNTIVFTLNKSDIENIEKEAEVESDNGGIIASAQDDFKKETNFNPAASIGESLKFDFKLDYLYQLKGDLDPELTFYLQEPNDKFKWARYIKALLNLKNNSSADKYVYVTAAIFDKNGTLLSASKSSWLDDTKVAPGGNYSINLDFALAGFDQEDISYFLINYKESDKSFLIWE